MQATDSDLDFVYRLSHDLGAPIRQVNAFASLLQSTDPAEPGSPSAQYIELIERQSKLAQLMLAALLDLSRLGATKVNSRDLLLANLISDIATTHPDLDIQSNIPADTTVLQDSTLLFKLLDLLAKNAVAHCDNPKWMVTSNVSTAPGYIDLLIRDNGPGLTAGQWVQFQQPFACKLGHADLDALGMGLTMAAKLAELIQANLSYAEVPSGLGFRLSLQQCLVPSNLPDEVSADQSSFRAS